MKYASLFTGIGGFDLALNRLGHECVYANDIDKYCKITYDRHFSPALDLRDIRTVQPDDIPDFDLICGGFPCQSFSVAGKRRGFEDTRGTLFFEIARLAKAKRTPCLLLENVKGLLNHDNGRTFDTIVRTLDELGYDVEWQVFDSFFFNSAPRPRVFIYALHREYADGILQRPQQTAPLYTCFSEGIRTADATREEDRRSAERIIRTFARLPDWLDRWDSFYPAQETVRERSDREDSL